MGKLLSRYESFIWVDVNINRSIPLQNFNVAITKAREKKDDIYRPTNIYDDNVASNIYNLMYTQGKFSFDDIKAHFTWLTADDYQVLICLPGYIEKITDRPSDNWAQFSTEFLGENVSMIGIEDKACLDPLVYDEASHTDFYAKSIIQFDFNKQKNNFRDFKKYYTPKLQLEASKIKAIINREEAPRGIIRLDDPPQDPKGRIIHNQKIHIHLKTTTNKECALNIDGTWKHPPPQDNNISIEICEILALWGFVLPDNYYS
ncbi:hypothetical protein [Elizabethkingia meningoseptica]|uniref:hypothetical protein n=1 Tax=Elizabethkingia meningoseptica TaxID=238 RepID=UPI002010EF9E|nr:hypothetical protein [Elizabethkingia meningoseptica]MCL1674305.1 hypothetical protein [Elizabethkingia meningoseptica]MCL1686074.1 hypothetical protein [Elizabethkingia meningoseptica]